jgi:GH25 family lysozyme M1 (1,4-beta-N-acetylmuramidase)
MLVQPAWAADPVPDGGGRAHAGAPPGPQMHAKAAAASNGYGWTVQGIDVSSHDHTTGGIDWPGVAASGVQFAYVKATEGSSYLNPYFHDDYISAKGAGILTGAYTYARPDHRDAVGRPTTSSTTRSGSTTPVR